MNKAELYYQVTHERLDDQDDRNRVIELKASGTLGLSITLMGIAVIVAKGFSTGSAQTLSTTSLTLFLGMGVWFLAVAVLALLISWARDFRRDPYLAKFAEYVAEDYKPEAMIEWIGDGYRDSVISNERTIERKASHLQLAMLALIGQVALLALLTLSVVL